MYYVKQSKIKGRHSNKEWKEMILFFNNKCVSCNGLYQKWIEKDHIIPISIGGSDSINNLQPLCQFCNQSKSNKSRFDYRELKSIQLNKKLPENYKNPY
jgi:5-methylcytosine-specific restriction endonuclease McrA